MYYTFEIDKEAKLIRIRATCLLTQEIRKQILLTAANQIQIHGFSKVLIDVTESTFQPDESMINALDLVNYLRFLGIPLFARLALICVDLGEHRKYFESVAQSDGVNLRYFKDEKSGLAWLEQSVG